jgi:hypothetical protein
MRYDDLSLASGETMRRREFITLLGSGAAASAAIITTEFVRETELYEA